jgi:hypothetical protein
MLLRTHRAALLAPALLASATLLFARSARPSGVASDETDGCFRAVDSGQHLRASRKLVAAKDQFIQCARQVCPTPVRKDCAEWLSEVETSVPSIVLGAKDARGADVLDVRVSVDGALLVERLDGGSIPVDPGPHVFHFEWAGHAPVDEQILIREGEKSRLVTAAFSPSLTGSTRETPTAHPIPVGVWILGGVAVLGGVGFAGLAASGQSEASSLRATCAPGCSASAVDSARTKIILANVSLGVGVASVAIATTWFILSRSSGGGTTALGVGPAPFGGKALFVVSF